MEKNNMSSLVELAGSCTSVYLDGCIVQRDKNYAEVKNQRGPPNDFAEKIGAAKRFSHLKYSFLKRHLSYISRFKDVIVDFVNIKSSPEVLKEYYPLVAHLETVLGFLKEHSSSKKKGRKEDLLSRIVGNYQQIYQLLKGRLPEESDHVQQLETFLKENRMHYPARASLRKKKGKFNEETSPGDANLVSHALIESLRQGSDVAVITLDLDIINLVINFQSAYVAGNSPLEEGTLQGRIAVYTPCEENWNPDFAVWRQACFG
jgi:hypothetical protein